MRRTRLATASLCLLLGGCGPVDGPIFTEATSGSQATDTTAAASSSAEAVEPSDSSGRPAADCFREESLQFLGGDPSFEHDCGEACDGNWCSCEPCHAVHGELGRLSAGRYRLSVEGGASGIIDYEITVSLLSGELLAEHGFTQEELFIEELEFVVEPDCEIVEFEWVQQTDACSRVYSLWVDRL